MDEQEMNPYYRLFLLWLSLWTLWLPRREKSEKCEVVVLAEWRRRRTGG